MKSSAGIILIVVGLLMILFTGINFKTKEKVIDAGPIEINKEKSHRVNWPPVAGTVLVVGGILVLLTNRKKV